VAEQLKGGSSITMDDALRPDASYEQFQDLLHHYARQKTIIVAGHNPNLSEFLSFLISGGTAKTAIELKKGALAKVDCKQGKAMLQWCVTPKLLVVGQASAKTSSRPKTSRK
jgi:phosphohistidine phosphatase SixA